MRQKIKINQQETQNTKQKHRQKKQTKANYIKTLLSRLRKRDSPISGRIQPRHEDKGKGSGCGTEPKKNTEGGKGWTTDTGSIAMG